MRKRIWGQKSWIIDYWLKRMKDPFPEPYSIRQAFYKELPEISNLVPEDVKLSSKDWPRNFYNRMCEYLSDLVLEGKACYKTINVLDDSGASKIVWQEYEFVEMHNPEEAWVEYPIEVWVENNATYNSCIGLFDGDKRLFQTNLVSTRGPAKTQQIESIKLTRSEDVKVILNFTDFDPSGYDMPRDLQNRCKRIGLKLDVKHIGILPHQIPEERRTVSLIRYKKRDPRAQRFRELFAKDPLVQKGFGYEIQALMPPEIREFTTKHILAAIREYGFDKRESA